ncbi:MAG TPA: YceI family protein [Myxococcales bacterium]|nr:YceI family protein [Myxococcales bacterium]
MFALVAILLSAAPAGQLLDLRQGTLTYTVVHKLHEVHGTSHQMEGRALAQPDGTVRVQVRAKLATFDSGNSNRDEHMREATHEAVHPFAEVKGTMSGVTLPLAGSREATLHATVELNGQKERMDVPVKLEPAGAGVHATFSFPISLDRFKVERPELLLIKVDDRATISGDLRFEAAK